MTALPRYVGATVAAALAYVRETVGDDFLRVFDLDGDGAVAPGSVDERAFVRAVCSAETEVDEHLAASHGAPFTGEIPDSVREVSAQRALWCAVRTRSSMSEAERAPLRLLYKDTDARLERIKLDAGGRIPGRPAPAPAASSLAHEGGAPATTWQHIAAGTSWSGF